MHDVIYDKHEGSKLDDLWLPQKQLTAGPLHKHVTRAAPRRSSAVCVMHTCPSIPTKSTALVPRAFSASSSSGTAEAR